MIFLSFPCLCNLPKEEIKKNKCKKYKISQCTSPRQMKNADKLPFYIETSGFIHNSNAVLETLMKAIVR